MKYKAGDKLFVVGGSNFHYLDVGCIVIFDQDWGEYLCVYQDSGPHRVVEPQHVVPYYDLKAIGFNYAGAIQGEISESFVWEDTPEGEDYWSDQYGYSSDLSLEGQERLDAMIQQYEILHPKLPPVEETMQKLEDWMLGSEHVCGKCEGSYSKTPQETSEPPDNSPDGGCQVYYDLPEYAVTLNDLIEHKSHEQWLGDSFHLANIMKAAWRWGIKKGTSKEYDARKFIYSGARLLMYYAGVDATRETLYKMLDDKQFGGESDG